MIEPSMGSGPSAPQEIFTVSATLLLGLLPLSDDDGGDEDGGDVVIVGVHDDDGTKYTIKDIYS